MSHSTDQLKSIARSQVRTCIDRSGCESKSYYLRFEIWDLRSGLISCPVNLPQSARFVVRTSVRSFLRTEVRTTNRFCWGNRPDTILRTPDKETGFFTLTADYCEGFLSKNSVFGPGCVSPINKDWLITSGLGVGLPLHSLSENGIKSWYKSRNARSSIRRAAYRQSKPERQQLTIESPSGAKMVWSCGGF